MRVLFTALLVLTASIATAAPPSIPLRFEENRGQAPSEIGYVVRTGEGTIGIAAKGVQVAMRGAGAPVMAMRFAGARDAEPRGESMRADTVSYLRGRDATRWVHGVSTFERVRARGIYEGIDVLYRIHERRLEYDFVVAPGASPSSIALRFDATRETPRLRVDRDGSLLVTAANSTWRHRPPVAYQEHDGLRRSVAARFRVDGDRVRFVLGKYDLSRRLVIDPELEFSTYLGGTMDDFARDVKMDATGIYIAGTTVSPDLIPFATIQPFHGATDVNYEFFVVKLARDGQQILWGTYFGSASGLGREYGGSIAVDPDGYVFFGGYSSSDDYPLLNAVQWARAGGYDAVVTKLTPDGRDFVFSTYIGGAAHDITNDLAVDRAGYVYLAGKTASHDFPRNTVIGQPYQSAYGGGAWDGFVSQLRPDGGWYYSTYFGGNGSDVIESVDVDASYDAYFTGTQTSTDLPLRTACFEANGTSAFVAKLDSVANQLLASGAFGGSSGVDHPTSIRVDGASNAYLAGFTESVDFRPLRNPTQPVHGGRTDLFVMKLDPTLCHAEYATFFGREHDEDWPQIAIDGVGRAYVTATAYGNFPVGNLGNNGLLGAHDHERDIVLFSLGGAGQFGYSGYLPGDSMDVPAGIDADKTRSAAVVVVGTSRSDNYPTWKPLQATNKHGGVNGTDLVITMVK